MRSQRLRVWLRDDLRTQHWKFSALCEHDVEVDGGYHAARRAADARRERVLRRLGYRVLRLDAELVLGAPEQALALVRAALAD